MGESIPGLIQKLLKESGEPGFDIEGNVDIVEGDVLATINGVDYAIVIETI